MSKILIGLGFNIAVAVAFYFFGASLTTCWFTFLFFCGFAGGAELSDHLGEAEKDLKWRLGNLKIDLENLEKTLGLQIKSSSNDPGQELAEITDRLAALERRFEEHDPTVAWQLECMRRLQLISDGIRELRTSAATAGFSSEAESKEEQSRSATTYVLGSIQQDIEGFRLPLMGRKNLSLLSMELEDIQRIVRQAILASPALSIEQIDSEAKHILDKLDGIRIEDEDAAKE